MVALVRATTALVRAITALVRATTALRIFSAGALNFVIVMPDATLILYFAVAHGNALYAVCITIFSCISIS